MQQQQSQSNMNTNTNTNMNKSYQSSPMQIQQTMQPPPSHNNTTTNTPQIGSSYAMTPPNSSIMNSSSFSPITNTYFSPSFTSMSGYFNTPQLSPQIRQTQQMQQQGQGQVHLYQPQPQQSIPQLNMPPPMQQQQSVQMPLQMPLQYQNNMSAGINAMLGQSIKTHKIYRPYFQLEMYVGAVSGTGIIANAESNTLRKLYENLVAEHNKVTLPIIIGTPSEYNAGFDLLAPTSMVVSGYSTIKVDHLVKCRMTKIIPHSSHPINVFQDSNGILRQYNTTILPVGFYLYPRSSTGTKTPLRLANSVGIIDSGYRGPLIAAFDNWKRDDYEIQDKQRLVQVCPPDLSYPIYVILVDSEEELGKTARGSGGFGSTG